MVAAATRLVQGVYRVAVLHFAADAAFDDLLTRWRSHERLRRGPGVTVVDLATSRAALDHARERMHRLRLALHPDDVELEGVVESVWCERLEAVVHLRWIDRDLDRPGNFACPCGRLVGIDWDRLGSPPVA